VHRSRAPLPDRRIDAAIIRDCRAYHHHPAAHHRRRGDLEFARPFQLHADIERDLAASAEIGAGNAGPGVERDHADVVGAHEDARAAVGVCGSLVIDPIGNAPAVIAIGGTLVRRDLRIVAPFLRAAAGIKRDDFVKRRAEDQAVLDQQRRRLKLRPLHHLGRTNVEVAGAKFPGADEIADVVRRDLVKRRKPRSSAIAAPMLPREGRRGGNSTAQRRSRCRMAYPGRCDYFNVPHLAR
jgi:hypothetical protein